MERVTMLHEQALILRRLARSFDSSQSEISYLTSPCAVKGWRGRWRRTRRALISSRNVVLLISAR